MSSTRHALANAPLSQGKYLSSPEYAELRGLSGTAVAAKAALMEQPGIRSLLWFLQALSLETGGLKKVARDLLAMFPDRLGSPTMHARGITPGESYGAADVRKIRAELDCRDCYPLKGECDVMDPEKNLSEYRDLEDDGDGFEFVRVGRASEAFARAMDLYRAAKQKADAQPDTYPASAFIAECRQAASCGLEKFLIDLCINPRVRVLHADEKIDANADDIERAIEEFPGLSRDDFRQAGVSYFRDIIGALYEFQRRHQEQIRAEFVLTEIGRKVWDTLDFALKARRMVLIDGLEGRGKTEAARAWCRLHRGEARFVSLKGITGKTNLFIAISKALGVGCGRGYSALEMQNRIESVLHRSGLALILDESHFLLDLKPRMYARPELVDWVDTALCNHEIPVGLVSTPQLLKSVQQAGAQTGWNHRQFRRRVKR